MPLGSSTPVFRQAALNRLGSPEQLDSSLVVTRPRTWIALTALLFVISAAVSWGVLGRITLYVSGPGLLMNTGGHVHVAVAMGNGILGDFLAGVGEHVEKGQLIGHVDSSASEQQVKGARDLVVEREAELQRQKSFQADEVPVRQASLAARRSALETQRLNSGKRVQALQSKLADDEHLFRDRIVTRTTVLQTQTSLAQAVQEFTDAGTQLVQLASQQQDATFQAEQRVKTAEFALAAARRQLEDAMDAGRTTTEVRAPVAGIITEVALFPGSLVNRGQPVLSIETPGDGVEMVLFLSHREGDKVDLGALARVSPSWTTREEEGSILARVREVSRYPLTPDAVRAIVHNEGLVRSFTRAGLPIVARLELLRDPQASSGYAWTSQRGADVMPIAGGSGIADVQIKQQRPIELVIPAIRRLLGA